jgi:hypothetical protein
MARQTVVFLLVLILTSHGPFGRAATPSDDGDTQSIQATFIALDVATGRVTYRPVDADGLRTSPVSSRATVDEFVKMHGGEKVVLKCRVTQPGGEVTVDDVKKKRGWLKRGIVLGVVVAVIVAFFTADWEI